MIIPDTSQRFDRFYEILSSVFGEKSKNYKKYDVKCWVLYAIAISSFCNESSVEQLQV